MAFTKDGIFYKTSGEGKVLIFTNGIMMSTESWKWHVDLFSKYFKVITFDFYCQGKSKCLKDLNLNQQVEALKSVIEEFKEEKPNVIGLSYGGQVLLKYLNECEEIIFDKIVISNTPIKIDRFLKEIGDAWLLASETNDPKRFFKIALPYIYGKTFYEKNFEFLENRINYFSKVINEEWFEKMRLLINSNRDFDMSNELKYFEKDTLFIASSEDVLSPIEDMKKIAENFLNSEMIIINSAGHAVFLEKKELWSKIVLSYFLF